MCDRRFSRHRTNTACTVEADIDNREAIANGDSRRRHRRCTILRTSVAGVRFGLWWGGLRTIGHPVWTIGVYRGAHRLALGHDTWKCSAARAIGQPSSTTRRAEAAAAISVDRQGLLIVAVRW
jgi:hypothetical protein